MAVQQNKKSPSRGKMRRAQQRLSSPTLAVEPRTGDRHLRHHVSASGYYRGKQVIEAPVTAETNEEE